MRSPNGGGTQNMSVEKAVICHVKTFFPEGNSKLGKEIMFDIEIRNFKGEYLSSKKCT